MSGSTHEDLVGRQFGARAADYVASPVHAAGPDLDRLAGIVGGAAGARVLDLGCGGGHVAFAVAPHVASVVAYDLSADMLDAVRVAAAERGLDNIAVREGLVERLPFEDGEFDCVFSRYSAHHWRDLGAALGEAHRVLKPAGRAAFADVVAPATPALDTHLQAIELLRDPSHVRDYSEPEWRRALEAAGFRPGPATPGRLRLEFASWIARMRPPAAHVVAIRSLQGTATLETAAHFEIEADGSFTVDTLLIEAARA